MKDFLDRELNVGDTVVFSVPHYHGLAKAQIDHFAEKMVVLNVYGKRLESKEYDTYKVGTVANSCSTMHKIHAKEFTLDDFSHEHLDKEELDILEAVILSLNWNRRKFLETKDKEYWWHMIQMLPSSYNQKRTVQLNYQVLKTMYFARKAHKLDEWHTFCEWCESLPYFKEICIDV